MKITVLAEDTKGKSRCRAEHGLSLYIETARRRVLADTGASDMLIENARILGVDLSTADAVILSHGHYDHSGGILPFSRINKKAKIYMRRTAGGEYYHGEKYIGIDKRILELENLALTDAYLEIDTELSLFSGINGEIPLISGLLSVKTADGFVPDDFGHEQCLVIREAGKNALVSGCAHSGIANILGRYAELYGGSPDVVVSGFHMAKKTPYTDAEKAQILHTARALAECGAVFYTGHCTGAAAFELMKPVMGDRLVGIHSGDVFEI